MMFRRTAIRLAAVSTLFLALYYSRCQYRFQRALSSSQIRFADFPSSYVAVLNASRAYGDGLLDFDYASSFPAPIIPRTIHFIWFQDLYASQTASSLDAHAPNLCRHYNPSYEIRIWNTSDAHNFIRTEYPWFLPTYTGYRYPIQRVDALKYFVLFHYGGVYMDLDVACRRPLDPLLQFPAWFPEASPLGVNNDLMASKKKHPVLLEMTSAMLHRDRNLLFPYLTIFWSTGPQFTSDILRHWWKRHGRRLPGLSQNAKHDDAAAFYVLPRIFYSEEYTFFGHTPGGTWHGGDVAVVLWFVDRPWATLSFCASLSLATVIVLRRTKSSNRQCRDSMSLLGA